MKNQEYLLALHTIDGLGPIRLKALLDYYEDSKLAWEAEAKELLGLGIPKNVVALLTETRKKLNPEKYLLDIKKEGVKWITIFDEDYPVLLKDIYDPPTVLYYKGELPGGERALGVVGTRKVSGYGQLVTEKFTSFLAESGVVIVSGLARGVDTLAHQTAVKVCGKTIAVLGGGLLKIFPSENKELAVKVSQGFGAVISEFTPDSSSLPGNFPARNRIISGLSKGILVTEAAEDSGSLITAKCALEQGREVFAVPGPITSDLSLGPALLIKQGARMVTEPMEILEELGWNRIKNKAAPAGGQESRIKSMVDLTETEKRVCDFLTNDNHHVDEICRELNLPTAQVSASLVKLEIQGIIKNLGGGVYVKV